MPDEHQQAVRELVMEWMRRAQYDLILANMVGNEEIAPEIIAFHAQQAVEKALKALLIQRQVDFPRTHIIGVLLNLCQENGYTLEKNLEEAVLLSEYAVTARYPGEMSEVNRQEAKTAVDQANKVFEWVEKQIDQE